MTPRTALLVVLWVAGCERTTVLDARPGRDACETCHRSLTASGHERGIENAHAGIALRCSDCHGGNPDGTDQVEAHGARTATPLRGSSTIGLTQADAAYLRLVNPADLRIAQSSCGSLSDTGQGCHGSIVSDVQRSLTATFAGALSTPRALLGAPVGPVGVVTATNGASTLDEGAVVEVAAFPHPTAVGDGDAELLDIYLRKACARCHAYDFGTNVLTSDVRGAGCGSCHMPYDADGLSRSEDSAAPEEARVGPVRHTLVRTPGEDACTRCHVGGARIAFSYHGKAPVESLGYLEIGPSQATRDAGDPDVHESAGLTCTDCHAGGELHGTDSLYASRYQSPTVRCTDCHGTTEEKIAERRDGTFVAAEGWVLPALVAHPDGAPRLRTADGVLHDVPQLADAEAPAEAHGAEHRSVACASCHGTFTINCIGCHVTLDDEGPPMPSLINELWQLGGAITEEGFEVDTSMFMLGEAPDGTVYPVVPAQAMLVSHAGVSGEVLRDRSLLRNAAGDVAYGLAAVDPHTTGAARPCHACHIAPDGGNEAAVRRILGASPSGASIRDGDDVEWDLGQILGEDLEPRYAAPGGASRPLRTSRARMLLEEPVP